MTHALYILAGGFQHPPLLFPSRELAVQAVEKAHRQRFVMAREPDATGQEGEFSESYIAVGPGTVYRIIAAESSAQKAREQHARRAAQQQGLIVAPPSVNDSTGYMVLVLLPQGQVDPALEFETFEDAQAFVRNYKPGELLMYDEGEVFSAFEVAPGMTLIVLSRDSYDRRRRMAIEEAMRQQQALQAQQQGVAKKLILPGN